MNTNSKRTRGGSADKTASPRKHTKGHELDHFGSCVFVSFRGSFRDWVPILCSSIAAAYSLASADRQAFS